VFRNAADKTWRVFLNMLPKSGDPKPVDLKCRLKKEGQVVSETWCYRWTPP
jgi:glucan biosynthesis protein